MSCFSYEFEKVFYVNGVWHDFGESEFISANFVYEFAYGRTFGVKCAAHQPLLINSSLQCLKIFFKIFV